MMQHLVQQQVKFSLVRNGAGGGGGVLYLMDRESAQYLLAGKIVV